MPRVSVIMNCYNGARYVKSAIESMYAQTYQDWEIIFWDNCSTDESPKIAKNFDSRLCYFRGEKTTPLGEARNLAMAQAKGEWIGFLDHDDACLPQRFEKQIAAVEGHDFALCYAGIREVDGEDRLIREVLPRYKSGNIFGELLTECEAFLQSTIVNRGYMQRYGIATDPSYMLFEDVNLFLKLAAKGPVCVVPEVLSVWRQLPTSLSSEKRERFPIEYFQLVQELREVNPGIDSHYPEAFRQADARAVYFQARLDLENGKAAGARRLLRSIATVRPTYKALYYLSLFPPLFNLVHNRTIKSKLTNLILR